ncbi:MAG: succinyl-CoA synthetase subunit beta [Pseudomonadota bacterium]
MMARRSLSPSALTGGALAVLSAGLSAQAVAEPLAKSAMRTFAEHCFSPFLTAENVARFSNAPGIRTEFYDLKPFSNVPPSPVTGRASTVGTDRRCEVAFDGDHGSEAATTAQSALEAEGIQKDAALPETHLRQPGTSLLAARYLNPNRIAVVHTGTRPGPNGTETFLNVERLTPEASRP